MTKKILISIYIFGFILLCVNHLYNFQINFIKFSTLSFINQSKLQFVYYYFILFEMISVVIFLIKKEILFKIYDFLFSFYFGVILFLFLFMKEISNNCIPCHYVASFIYEDYKITSIFIFILFAIYILLRLKFSKEK